MKGEWYIQRLGRNTYIERDGEFICDMDTGNATDKELQIVIEHAKLIVKAVNSYSHMLEALRSVKIARINHLNPTDFYEAMEAVCIETEKALENAKGF
jgi:hypothetical protein